MGKIQYKKQPLKFLKSQDVRTRQRLVQAIEKLPNGDVRPLQGRPFKRLRVGAFRIIFDDMVIFLSLNK